MITLVLDKCLWKYKLQWITYWWWWGGGGVDLKLMVHQHCTLYDWAFQHSISKLSPLSVLVVQHGEAAVGVGEFAFARPQEVGHHRLLVLVGQVERGAAEAVLSVQPAVVSHQPLHAVHVAPGDNVMKILICLYKYYIKYWSALFQIQCSKIQTLAPDSVFWTQVLGFFR